MTTTLSARLRNLAAAAQSHVAESVRALAPKLHLAADDVEHTLEAWTTAVDHWVELHFAPEAEKLREDAGAAYRASVANAHELIDEAKARL